MKKIILMLPLVLSLFGCSDDNEKKASTQKIEQPQIVKSVDSTEKEIYSKANNYYKLCLVTNGIEEDDYCEESCSLIYNENVCDKVEDSYEDIVKAIKKNKDSNKVVYKTDWTKTNLLPNCSDWVMDSSNQFVERTCFQQYKRTIVFKDKNTYEEIKYENIKEKKYVKENVSSVPVVIPVAVPSSGLEKQSSYEKEKIKNDKIHYDKTKYKQLQSNLVKKEKIDKKDSNVEKETHSKKEKAVISDKQNTNLVKYKQMQSSLVKKDTKKDDVKKTVVEKPKSDLSKYKTKQSNLVKVKKEPVTIKKISGWKNVGSKSCKKISTDSKTKKSKYSCTQKMEKTIYYSNGKTKKERKNKQSTIYK